MNSHRYTASATMKALRDIFEENRHKSLEERWAIARASESYRGFQIRCSTSAKVLAAATIPLLIVGIIIGRSTTADDHPLSIIFIAILYIALSVTVSWNLGIKVAAKKMAKLRPNEGRSM
jgi:hypothetical protein